MRLLLVLVILLLIVGGGMKLAGMQLPVFDYPLGGPFTQPNIDVVEPDLNLP